MTTAENLNRIIEAKSDIKQAIEEKGVTVGDITIDGYADKVREIAQSGTGGKWVVPENFIIYSYDGNVLDLQNWDVSNCTTLSMMFQNDSKLVSIDVTSWNTSKVTRMYSMFAYCPKLTEIKGIGNWDTSNVTDMSYMFEYCTNLTSLDLGGWDMHNVFSLDNIFNGCTSLTEVKMGTNIKFNLELSSSTKLTVKSLLSVLNGLYDFTGNGETPNPPLQGKLTLGSTNLAKLSDEQKTIAINKGWTLS